VAGQKEIENGNGFNGQAEGGMEYGSSQGFDPPTHTRRQSKLGGSQQTVGSKRQTFEPTESWQ
jgi:hypothetical protein